MDMTEVFFLFILVSGIVLLVLVLRSTRGSGRLKVGAAELQIDFENSPGWVKSPPPQTPAGRAPAANPACWLSVRGTSWRYPLNQSTVYIGRGADNQIKLRDKTADTRQAVIYWEDGRYKINNLSPRVSTRVNGRPITKQNLGDGNTIQMGRTRLIFRRPGR